MQCGAHPCGTIPRFSARGGGLGERQRHPDTAKEGAARSELSGAHSDTRSVSDLISMIEHVDAVEPYFGPAEIRHVEVLRNAGVGLDVERQVSHVDEAAAQAASVQVIEAEAEAVPVVRSAAGGRERLVVIEEDKMVLDEVDLILPEDKLARYHVFTLGNRIGEICIGVEVARGI